MVGVKCMSGKRGNVRKKGVIGIDLGGTNIKSALVSLDGNILYRTKKPTEASFGRERILKNIFAVIDELMDYAHKVGCAVESIGLGSPGWVDRGVVKAGTENLPGWAGTDIKSILEERFSIPSFADNDVNVVALGELLFGAARGYRYVVVITLGTGIGGGIIIDGKLYRGAWGYAGEIGHTTIDYNGKMCNCGSFGCIEAYSGAWGISEIIRSLRKKNLLGNIKEETPRGLAELAKSGDRVAINVFEEMAFRVGIALANAANLLNPELIVVGGGVTAAWDMLEPPLKEAFHRYALPGIASGLKIRKALLGDDAGVMGAAALAMRESGIA